MSILSFIFTTWQGLGIIWIETTLVLWLVIKNRQYDIKWQDRDFSDRAERVIWCMAMPILVLTVLADQILTFIRKALEFKLDFWRDR